MEIEKVESKLDILAPTHILFYVIIFVIMGSLGQIAIHIVVPSIDAIAVNLQVSANVARHAISVFLAAFAISLPFAGPLVDKFGRARVLYSSLVVYIISGLVCMIAPSAKIFFLFRILQGLGAGAGVVVSRALSRDRFEGTTLTKAIAYTNIAMATVPAFSPLIGGIIFEDYGWRSLFLVTSLCGLLSLFISYTYFSQTQSQQRVILSTSSFINLYLSIIKSKKYMSLSFLAAFQHATWWIFLSGTPNIFINQLGFSITQYGSILPFVVGAYIFGSMVTASFATQISGKRLLLFSFILQIASMCILVLLPFLGHILAYGIVLPELVNSACVGTTVAVATAGALQIFPEKAGTAAALNTFITLAIAAIMTSLVNITGASALSVTSLMAASAIISSIAFFITCKRTSFN